MNIKQWLEYQKEMANFSFSFYLVFLTLSRCLKRTHAFVQEKKMTAPLFEKTEFLIIRKQNLASHVCWLAVISTPETRNSQGLYSQSKSEQWNSGSTRGMRKVIEVLLKMKGEAKYKMVNDLMFHLLLFVYSSVQVEERNLNAFNCDCFW